MSSQESLLYVLLRKQGNILEVLLLLNLNWQGPYFVELE